MKPRTRFIHAARKASHRPSFVNPPVDRASTVTFESVAQMKEIQARFDADEPVPTYGIANMPLRNAFEEFMVALEGGHRAVAFPSGLAAVAGAVLAAVGAGEHLLVTDSVYGPTRRLCDRLLKRFGVVTDYFDPLAGAGIESCFKPNTRAVYVESPGSHTFEVHDLPAIAAAARSRGITVIHDNTWATGLFFRSFDHGSDLVVQAATKYPAGHSDVLIGAVVANERLWPALRDTARDLGQHVSPDDLYLALRGARTMELRLREQQANSLQIARRLQSHPAVARVLHPALESDPGHSLWKRDFLGSTGLFAIELLPCPEAAVARFIDSLEFFALGYSWGGYESLVTPANLGRYARSVRPWTGGPLVRLQVGLEDPEDLLQDLERGLAALHA